MASPSLQAFDPLAEYYFTSATASTRPEAIHAGVPRAVYPSHVLVASTSPSRATPPKNNSVPSQLQRTPQNIQSPKPTVQSKGFAIGKTGGAIFEPFAHTRSVTPELDGVLKKKAAQWGQWELEQ